MLHDVGLTVGDLCGGNVVKIMLQQWIQESYPVIIRYPFQHNVGFTYRMATMHSGYRFSLGLLLEVCMHLFSTEKWFEKLWINPTQHGWLQVQNRGLQECDSTIFQQMFLTTRHCQFSQFLPLKKKKCSLQVFRKVSKNAGYKWGTYGTLYPVWRLWSTTSPAPPTKGCLSALPSPDCKSGGQSPEQTETQSEALQSTDQLFYHERRTLIHSNNVSRQKHPDQTLLRARGCDEHRPCLLHVDQ